MSLVLHQNDAPVGWRIHITPGGPQEGYPVTIKQAENFARAATEIIDTVTQDDRAVTPFQIVRNGTTALKTILEAQLSAAEAQAASIASLRRTLSELEQ